MLISDIQSPTPLYPVPSHRQLRWHTHEFYGFLHFGLNTFTDKEWGYGDESPELFAPTNFDADQIASTANEVGMSGLILTCKHHDGFCLWPSRYTDHSVKSSPWKGGQGDVVAEMADACQRYDILFGVYLSPWDRNHAEYGRPAYLEYYRKQLIELTTEYGDLFEVWFDGANGGDGYYGGVHEQRRIDRRTYYDWENTWKIVRQNQPDAVMFSDVGPDVRWVGNENGIAGAPCWSTLSTAGLYPGFGGDDWTTELETDMVQAWASDQQMLNQGYRQGDSWLPAECDVSIRPGWFYHSSEDDKVKSAETLLDLYFKSVGRGASLLLNIPPDKTGQFHPNDVQNLQEFRRLREQIFSRDLTSTAHIEANNIRGNSHRFSAQNLVDNNTDTYWSTDDNISEAEVIFEFQNAVSFNTIGIREYLPLGQRVDNFTLEIEKGGVWQSYYRGTAIGNLCLVREQKCSTQKIRFRCKSNFVCPAISEFKVYLAP